MLVIHKAHGIVTATYIRHGPLLRYPSRAGALNPVRERITGRIAHDMGEPVDSAPVLVLRT